MKFSQIMTAIAVTALGAQAQTVGEFCDTTGVFMCAPDGSALLRCNEIRQWEISGYCNNFDCGPSDNFPFLGCP